jgi:hypothetical protein
MPYLMILNQSCICLGRQQVLAKNGYLSTVGVQTKWQNVATFNTQKTVNLYENIQPGRTVQVWYTTTPNTLDNNTDDYTDVTGLPSSSVEVVTLGACYKLLSYVDAGRINLSSAEADLNDTKIPSTAGVASSRYIFALYQQRLSEEALKLKDKYPIRIHYTS